MATLQRVVLYVREAGAALAFWNGALGLPVAAAAESWAELAAGGGVTLTLQTAPDSEAQLSVGYSPVLQFTVTELDSLVPTLLMAGASLDGAIKYTPVFKLAMLRAPTGHMFTVMEPQGGGGAPAPSLAPPLPPAAAQLR